MKWYYEKNEEPQGPFSLEEILPVIKPETLVWREDSLSDWVEAKNHPLLKPIFNLNVQNQTSSEKLAASKTEELKQIPKSKIITPFEINLVLKTDWKTKGFGSRGVCYLYVESTFIQSISLDGFDIKIKTEVEKPDIKIVDEAVGERAISEKWEDGWLTEFPNDIITTLNIPKLDCSKNYKIELEYGDRKPSIFYGDMGIMPKPKSITPY